MTSSSVLDQFTFNKITATDDATGQSRFAKNSSQSTLPIILVEDPPNSDGITNSPIVGMNTNKLPAMMPGLAIGKVTDQKALILEQPKSNAASNKEGSIFSSVE